MYNFSLFFTVVYILYGQIILYVIDVKETNLQLMSLRHVSLKLRKYPCPFLHRVSGKNRQDRTRMCRTTRKDLVFLILPKDNGKKSLLRSLRKYLVHSNRSTVRSTIGCHYCSPGVHVYINEFLS